MTLRREDLAYWDRRVDRFVVEGGSYTVSIGASSRDLRVTGTVDVSGDCVRVPLTLNSTLAEVISDPVAGSLVKEAFASLMPRESESDAAEALGIDIMSLLGSAPVGRMVSLSGGAITRPQLEDLLAQANAAAQ